MAEAPSNGSGFEEALDALERVVARLDREDLSLDEALELFEAGVGHLRTATRLLDEARGVVEELIEEASGELATMDFELAGADGDDGGD